MDIIDEVLVTKEQLREKTLELAKRINIDYKGKTIFIVSALNGGFIFTADLVREISGDVEINFIQVSSYGKGTETSGRVKVLKGVDEDVRGKDILIVEDIIDTGVTISYLRDMLLNNGANTVEICAMLTKPARRKIEIGVKYLGYELPDKFVVGYGLDYAGKYRNLPYVGVLNPEIYS